MRFPARPALRRLLRARTFTLTAVFTLALGIAANVAVFSVIRTVLLEPLPYSEPDELVALWHTAPGIGIEEVNQSAALHFTYLDHSEVFESVALWDSWRASMTGQGEPEEIPVHSVSAELLPLLGIDPEIGRVFTPADDQPNAPLTTMIGYDYWHQRFGADPDILGRSLTLQGRDYTVIGVLPKQFRILDHDYAALLPAQLDRAETFLGMFNFQGIGRLEDGVTIEQASQDVNRLLPVAAENYPGGMTNKILDEAQFAASLRPLAQQMVGDVSQFLWILFAAAGVVLLIACANVANLFLVRAEARQRELAVRSALGAGRGTIARELLSESLLLGSMAGIVALPLAWGLVRLLRFLGPESLPRVEQISVTPAVVTFAVLVSLLSGLIFGLLPSLRQGLVLSRGLVEALKEGGRGGTGGRSPARAVLAVAQIALGLVLLTGSGLLLRSFNEMRGVDPGFANPDQVLTFRVGIPSASIDDPMDAVRMQHSILDNLAALPGVTSVGATTALPLSGTQSADGIYIEGFPVEEGSIPPVERLKFVTPGLFGTLQQPILFGRDLDWRDVEERRDVVLVSEDLARKYWGEPSAALGKRISGGTPTANDFHWREVVGVVRAVHDDGPARDTVSTIYFPIAMSNFWGSDPFVHRSLSYAVRTDRVNDLSLLGEFQQCVWAVNPDLPLARVETMGEILRGSMAQASFAMFMLLLAASVALLIGSVGIYGVIAYLVAQRTREFGVRMALGATGREVTGMVLRYGMKLASAGVLAGLIASGLLAGSLSRLLYGVEPRDPLTFAVVAVLLCAVAFVATALAGRRASRVDPIEALRAD